MRLWKAALAALAAAAMLAAGTTASLAAGTTAGTTASHAAATVPWGKVGPGWVLTQYANAKPEGGRGPQTLYLISPGGTRYKLASWPDNQNAPQLVAWSPDGKRALLQVFSPKTAVEQMTLATGAVTTFTLPGEASPIGYTTPAGHDIVASQVTGDVQSLGRYSLTGRLLQSLGTSVDGRMLYKSDGTELATGAVHGIKLVSNNGTLIRQLNVPGTAANGCGAQRWWNRSTLLVTCAPPGNGSNRLWLVPVTGARPKALTPPRPANSQDLGDLDAWQLNSGLYLQAAGPCGVLYIFRQRPGGSIELVTVPHTVGNDSHVLTALGSRLLVQAPTSCTGSDSLFWFDPASKAEQWVIRAPGNVSGVTMAIPFYSRENAAP